ncbi:uncharacterized protein V1510DRAFT_431106 [Dipodascopsis tothii]|uniref:uncharacterized protein n=1 Tax=Dipodascopsis tothii TaxID=44089 RepID=UPI0034CF7BEB
MHILRRRPSAPVVRKAAPAPAPSLLSDQDVLQALPPPENFRQSLIMPNLIQRFSVLRHDDDAWLPPPLVMQTTRIWTQDLGHHDRCSCRAHCKGSSGGRPPGPPPEMPRPSARAAELARAQAAARAAGPHGRGPPAARPDPSPSTNIRTAPAGTGLAGLSTLAAAAAPPEPAPAARRPSPPTLDPPTPPSVDEPSMPYTRIFYPAEDIMKCVIPEEDETTIGSAVTLDGPAIQVYGGGYLDALPAIPVSPPSPLGATDYHSRTDSDMTTASEGRTDRGSDAGSPLDLHLPADADQTFASLDLDLGSDDGALPLGLPLKAYNDPDRQMRNTHYPEDIDSATYLVLASPSSTTAGGALDGSPDRPPLNLSEMVRTHLHNMAHTPEPDAARPGPAPDYLDEVDVLRSLETKLSDLIDAEIKRTAAGPDEFGYAESHDYVAAGTLAPSPALEPRTAPAAGADPPADLFWSSYRHRLQSRRQYSRPSLSQLPEGTLEPIIERTPEPALPPRSSERVLAGRPATRAEERLLVVPVPPQPRPMDLPTTRPAGADRRPIMRPVTAGAETHTTGSWPRPDERARTPGRRVDPNVRTPTRTAPPPADRPELPATLAFRTEREPAATPASRPARLPERALVAADRPADRPAERRPDRPPAPTERPPVLPVLARQPDLTEISLASPPSIPVRNPRRPEPPADHSPASTSPSEPSFSLADVRTSSGTTIDTSRPLTEYDDKPYSPPLSPLHDSNLGWNYSEVLLADKGVRRPNTASTAPASRPGTGYSYTADYRYIDAFHRPVVAPETTVPPTNPVRPTPPPTMPAKSPRIKTLSLRKSSSKRRLRVSDISSPTFMSTTNVNVMLGTDDYQPVLTPRTASAQRLSVATNFTDL